MIVDFEELLEDFRSGPPVEIAPEPFGHLRSVYTVAEVLADLLGMDHDAALVAAEEQVRKLAVERLAAWTPAGRGH